MEAQSDYLISSPEKIFSKLAVLVKNKNLLTVGFGVSGVTFVTTLLELNKKENIYICDGCDESLVEQVINSSRIHFKTDHLGALVSFDSAKAVKTQYNGELAFSLPIPTSMRWFEQREFYRVRIPTNSSSFCKLTFGDKQTANLKLYDISIRGFSMLNTSEEISEFLTAGEQLEKCILSFEDKDQVVISFEIRSKFVLNPKNLVKTEKIGCQFTQMTPAFENKIHSYMLDIEREILKKRAENTYI